MVKHMDEDNFVQNMTLGDKQFIAKKTDTTQKKQRKAPKHNKGELFLCGPVPWDWLTTASKVSGKGSGLQIALALWFLSGLNQRSDTVKLTSKTLKSLGVQRNAGYRGLITLEKSGLISVIRKKGASPIVTLISTKKQKNSDGELL